MELSHFTLVLTDHHTLGEKGGRDVELSHFTLVVTDHHTLGEKGRRDVELSHFTLVVTMTITHLVRRGGEMWNSPILLL